VALYTSQPTSLGLRLSQNEVFWTAYDSPNAVDRVSKDGGSTVQVSQSPSDSYPSGIDLDENEVFWSGYGSGQIYAAPRGGGERRVVVETEAAPTAVRVDADSVYFVIWQMFDPTNDQGGVYRAPKAGGTAVRLGSGTGHDNSASLDLDATHVYYLDGPRVMRVAKTGGAPEVLWETAADAFAYPAAVVVTRSHVYWATSSEAYLDDPSEIRRLQK
jgi:hypothetical protein